MENVFSRLIFSLSENDTKLLKIIELKNFKFYRIRSPLSNSTVQVLSREIFGSSSNKYIPCHYGT
jgi:hypothetical protein